MKRSRFTEVQMAYAFQQAERGIPAVDVCRSISISEATFYSWKKKYQGLGTDEVTDCLASRKRMPV
jgi:putative transposase